MHWLYPTYLWAELIPGLLACAWILSEWQRHRRLRDFCDPAVMGIVTPWRYRIAAILMLLLGASSTIALIPLPVLNEETSDFAVPAIQLMLDQQSLDSRAGPFWEGLESSVQALVEQVPGSRFSFSIAGLPPRVIVYPTVDAKGLLIVLSGLRLEPRQAIKSELGPVLQKQSESQAPKPRHFPLVVISALPIDEVERAAAALQGDPAALLLVHLPGGIQPPQYGYQTAAGKWVWTLDPGQTGGILKMERSVPGVSGLPKLTQWVAALAFLLLGAEYVLGQTARVRLGGYSRG